MLPEGGGAVKHGGSARAAAGDRLRDRGAAAGVAGGWSRAGGRPEEPRGNPAQEPQPGRFPAASRGIPRSSRVPPGELTPRPGPGSVGVVWRRTLGAAAVTVVLGGSLLARPVHSENSDGPPAASVDLTIRAGALGLSPEALRPGSAAALGLEAVRAPTGAGTMRMPQPARPGERGVVLGVKVCEPDGTERTYFLRVERDASLPEGPFRSPAPGPWRLGLPGRPLP